MKQVMLRQHCVMLHVVLLWLEIQWPCSFLLFLEILHFDWLVNWLGPMVLEGALGVHTPGWSTFTHIQDRLGKSSSASRTVTKNCVITSTYLHHSCSKDKETSTSCRVRQRNSDTTVWSPVSPSSFHASGFHPPRWSRRCRPPDASPLVPTSEAWVKYYPASTHIE